MRHSSRAAQQQQQQQHQHQTAHIKTINCFSFVQIAHVAGVAQIWSETAEAAFNHRNSCFDSTAQNSTATVRHSSRAQVQESTSATAVASASNSAYQDKNCFSFVQKAHVAGVAQKWSETAEAACNHRNSCFDSTAQHSTATVRHSCSRARVQESSTTTAAAASAAASSHQTAHIKTKTVSHSYK